MTSDLDTLCYCPFHEGPNVASCELEQCDLWVAKHHLKCGYVAYREHHAAEGSEELSWDALGAILGYEGREAEHLSRQAYEILRHLAVQDQVPAEWSLLRNSKRCVVCDKPAEIYENGWGWCGDDCYQWLPPAAVEAEARWGTWFRKLLTQWRQLTVRTIERLTGLNKDTIRWMLWQHLGWGDGEDEPNRWLRCDEPLVPNPRIPCVKEILRRVEAAEQWGKR
jgi:hypothetical protein